MAIGDGIADTCLDVLFGEAEELDTVGLLLQPIQLQPAGCIVYDKYCSFALVAITVLLPWLCFALQSVSSYVYNSRCKEFYVETCTNMSINGHSSSCNYSFQATTTEMIHHCGVSLSEQQTADLLICHGMQQDLSLYTVIL